MEAPVDTPYSHSLLKDRGQYQEMYTRSIEQPAQFWGEIARQFHWETPVRFPSLLHLLSYSLLIELIMYGN